MFSERPAVQSRGYLQTTLLALSLTACAPDSASESRTTDASRASNHAASPLHTADLTLSVAPDSGLLLGPSLSAAWRSTTLNGRVRLIEEVAKPPYAMEHVRRYEFDSTGALVYFVEDTRSLSKIDSTGVPEPIRHTEIEFAGEIAPYRSRRDRWMSHRVREFEVQRIVARAQRLMDSAQRKTQSPVRAP